MDLLKKFLGITLPRPLAVALIAYGIVDIAHAQRESFNASKEATPQRIADQLSSASKQSVVRQGVDKEGKPKIITAKDSAVHFDNILFQLDSAELKDRASERQISTIANALRSNRLQGRSFLIEGHTCDLGSDRHNLQLSAQRAESVKSLLETRGVGPQHLATIGMGESEPLPVAKRPANDTEIESQRSRNRRVVIRVMK